MIMMLVMMMMMMMVKMMMMMITDDNDNSTTYSFKSRRKCKQNGFLVLIDRKTHFHMNIMHIRSESNGHCWKTMVDTAGRKV